MGRCRILRLRGYVWFLRITGGSVLSTCDESNQERSTTGDAPSATLFFDLIPSPIGDLFVAVGPAGVVALEFHPDGGEAVRLAAIRGARVIRSSEAVAPVAAQLAEYFAGCRRQFDLAMDLSSLSAFERDVLAAVAQIPPGQTLTYGEVARAVGKPAASQAVGQALGRNPVPIVIPCHRVIAGGGRIGGYSGRGGVETKQALLRLEGGLLL